HSAAPRTPAAGRCYRRSAARGTIASAPSLPSRAMRWVALSAIVTGCGGGAGMMMPPDGSIPGMPDGSGSNPGPDGGDMPPSAADLLGKLVTCNPVGGDYATDSGGTQDIPICGLPSAVFWKADMDIDCDGKQSAQCNLSTDPDFQNQTSATD